jgi:hypothetical protein
MRIRIRDPESFRPWIRDQGLTSRIHNTGRYPYRSAHFTVQVSAENRLIRVHTKHTAVNAILRFCDSLG